MATKTKPCVKAHSNILQQDVYLREVAPLTEPKSSPKSLYYNSIVEVVTDKGIELKRTVEEYPITPETVASYVDSCDYKSDPLQAANRPAPGKNLGDISSVQMALKDVDGFRAEYEALVSRYTDSFEASSEKKNDSVENLSQEGSENV